MKETRLLILCSTVTLALLSGGVSHADPMGSAFTYQGQLDDAGAPASGDFDFTFELHDHPDNGSQVGGTVIVDDHPVSNGLFTVKLDFGFSAFDGEALWLEVGVRAGSSTGAYTTLAPRQELTPSAYAIYAEHADTVGGYTLSGLDARYVNEGQQGSVTGAMIVDGTITQADIDTDGVGSAEIASGAVGTSEIATNSIDDSDMGFMRWGKWQGSYSDVIFETAGFVKVYLLPSSNDVYVESLTTGYLIVGHVGHQTAAGWSREVLTPGQTTSFSTLNDADISLNITATTPDDALFFRGIQFGQSSGTILVGYYAYFDSLPLKTDGGHGDREGVPIQLAPRPGGSQQGRSSE